MYRFSTKHTAFVNDDAEPGFTGAMFAWLSEKGQVQASPGWAEKAVGPPESPFQPPSPVQLEVGTGLLIYSHPGTI